MTDDRTRYAAVEFQAAHVGHAGRQGGQIFCIGRQNKMPRVVFACVAKDGIITHLPNASLHCPQQNGDFACGGGSVSPLYCLMKGNPRGRDVCICP